MTDRSALPSKLYKYQPFTTQSLLNLKVRSVWFARPSSFNDPFDCFVPPRIAELTLEDCRRLLDSKGKLFDVSKLNAHPQLVAPDGTPSEELRALFQASSARTLAESANQLYWQKGVTCFSERHDDILLWGHYGGAHRGFCLEFDTESILFERVHRVRYHDEVPEINFVHALLTDDADALLTTALTKASCWSYEREWRAIHHQAETLFGYGWDALSGVYFGCMMRDVEIDLIAHMLAGSPTRLYKVRTSKEGYRLNTDAVSYTPFDYAAGTHSGKRTQAM